MILYSSNHGAEFATINTSSDRECLRDSAPDHPQRFMSADDREYETRAGVTTSWAIRETELV